MSFFLQRSFVLPNGTATCSQNLCDQEAINAAASFSKADDFSIVNLLSLKFR